VLFKTANGLEMMPLGPLAPLTLIASPIQHGITYGKLQRLSPRK